MNHGSLLLRAVMANLFRRMGRRILMKRSQLNRKLGLVVESGHGDADKPRRPILSSTGAEIHHDLPGGSRRRRPCR